MIYVRSLLDQIPAYIPKIGLDSQSQDVFATYQYSETKIPCPKFFERYLTVHDEMLA